MPRLRTPFTGAQQLRALAIDLLEMADVLEVPPADTMAVEQRVACIEALGEKVWAVGRGRRPLGFR